MSFGIKAPKDNRETAGFGGLRSRGASSTGKTNSLEGSGTSGAGSHRRSDSRATGSRDTLLKEELQPVQEEESLLLDSVLDNVVPQREIIDGKLSHSKQDRKSKDTKGKKPS